MTKPRQKDGDEVKSLSHRIWAATFVNGGPAHFVPGRKTGPSLVHNSGAGGAPARLGAGSTTLTGTAITKPRPGAVATTNVSPPS
jgi:hypothetical protein